MELDDDVAVNAVVESPIEATHNDTDCDRDKFDYENECNPDCNPSIILRSHASISRQWPQEELPAQVKKK